MKVQLHESLLGRKQEDFKEDVEYTELRPRVASVLESEIGTWRLRASKAVEKEEGATLDPMKIQETEHPPNTDCDAEQHEEQKTTEGGASAQQ